MSECRPSDSRGCALSNGGFTLVELLVLVAIVVTLIAMLLPAIDRAKGEARSVHCMSLHKQYAMSFILYGVDNGDEFPLFADVYPAPTAGTHWYETTAPYHGEEPNRVLNSQTRLCPSGRAGVGVPYGQYRTNPFSPIIYGNHGPFLFKEVNYPSTWAMLLDSGINHYFMYTYFAWTPDVDTDSDSFPDTDLGVMAHFGAGGQYNGARPRVHRDIMTMAMVDGHAERLDIFAFLGKWNSGVYEPHDLLRDDR